MVLTWGGTSVFHLLTAGRRNRWLEGTFGRYLAPAIISALKDEPGLLELGGRKREITILFSDVAGFTKLTEALEPHQMVTLLNRYLTPHAAAVMEQGGVVDKFIGDAVMAFFGDPLPDPQHAEKCCRAALTVQKQLPDLRPVWEEMGLDGLRGPHRRQLRRGHRRQHGQREPLRLHGDGRRGEPREPARGREQGLRHAHPPRLPDPPGGGRRPSW